MRLARSSASSFVFAVLLVHVVGCSSKSSMDDNLDGSPAADSSTSDSSSDSSTETSPDASHRDASLADGSEGGVHDGSEADGDVSSSESDAGDPDAPVDVETMRRHFVAANALLHALSDLGTTKPDPVERMAAFGVKARTITDVIDVVLHPDGYDAAVKLWDGEVISFSAGMKPDGTAPTPPPPAGVTAFDYSIPKTKKALLLQMTGLEGAGTSALADLQSYFTAAGYSVTTGAPDLPTLRTGVDGYAALYINTHGEDGKIFTEQKITDSAGNPIEYEVLPAGAKDTTDLTGDFAKSTERDTTIRSERIRGLLTWGAAQYYNAAEDKMKWSMRYFITPSWITTYWHLEPHAVVHFDACHTAESRQLADAVQTAGADVFLGWVHPAPYPGCYAPSRRFWDDVLGTNIYSTIAEPQRPFDVDAVMDYMSSKNLDKASGAILTKLKKSGSDSVILVPSIEHIEMGPLDAWFTVFGQFGVDPGKISIGGVDTVCGDWKTTKLDHCALPKIGAPGAYGPVVVDYDGRKSNAVPITHWTGTLNYSENAAPLVHKIALTFHLRADVHRYRTKPRETPLERTLASFFTDRDSATQCVWTYTNGGCSGGGTVPFVPGSSPQCSLQVKIDTSLPEAQRIKLQPLLAGTKVPCGGTTLVAPDFYGNPYLPDETPLSGSTTGNWFWPVSIRATPTIWRRVIARTRSAPASFDIQWSMMTPDAPPSKTDKR